MKTGQFRTEHGGDRLPYNHKIEMSIDGWRDLKNDNYNKGIDAETINSAFFKHHPNNSNTRASDNEYHYSEYYVDRLKVPSLSELEKIRI